jgi:hypothetical protein
MHDTAHEISCRNCRSPVSTSHRFYFELETPEEWDAFAAFAAGACLPVVCPECAHENPTDLPVSVYDAQLNRLYHYMPADEFNEIDLSEIFDFEVNLNSTMLGRVFDSIQNTKAFASGVLERAVGESSFSFRVFYSLMEVVQQAFAGARVVDAHRAKAERYRTLEPPSDFLERGSRRYKRNKLRFIYCLGQGFEEGRTYSRGEVDRIILHERRYLRENPIDGSHARVALVELGILERSSCGSVYWRKPDPSRIHGLSFPSLVEGFEKWGYIYYDGPDLGFSVGYRNKALESGVTFYVYGAPDLEISAQVIETEFSNTRDGMLLHFESEGRNAEILQEKRLTLDKHAGRAETVCHLTLRITNSDFSTCRSHFLLTAWGGHFIKVRMTSPDTIRDDDEVLSRLVAALLKKIASAKVPTVSDAE